MCKDSFFFKGWYDSIVKNKIANVGAGIKHPT